MSKEGLLKQRNVRFQDEIYSNPLINYQQNEIVCTHQRRPMGEWTQEGRYKCVSFVDPALLRFNGEECSLEEARCRSMKPIWNQQLEQANKLNSSLEEDDMMMTMNVGKILYNKNNPELSIPSTIKEEPSSTFSNISTDFTRKNNRKRKTSDQDGQEQGEGGGETVDHQPPQKRMKYAMMGNFPNNYDEAARAYDVFAELTTQTNYTNTIQSHIDTPLKRLDFATPGSLLLSKQTSKLTKMPLLQRNNNSIEQTGDIASMTAFFNQPLKITDKRMADTPTVTNMRSRKILNPTATITFHSKAAMNDIVEIFGGGNPATDTAQQHDTNNNNVDNQEAESFGIYEDTATIHTKIDIGKIQINDDVPAVDSLSNAGDRPVAEEDASQLPLPTIMESDDNDDDEKGEHAQDAHICDRRQTPPQQQSLQSTKPKIVDPLQVHKERQNENLTQRYLTDSQHAHCVFDERSIPPPVSIDDLLNGVTDIELNDEEDISLNVTEECIKSASREHDNHYVFMTNDLSQDDDCERLLVIDTPASLHSYHISNALQHRLSESNANLSMEYALVQSVYVYNNASFSISRTIDPFQTLQDAVSAFKQKREHFHEKLLLYFTTEMIRIVAQLHECNLIHLNLSLKSFLVKIGTANEIEKQWSADIANGWQYFGLFLHDLDACIKLDDHLCLVDGDDEEVGCLIAEKNLNGSGDEKQTKIWSMFQKLVNHQPFLYEMDYFSIFVMVVQLLTQNEDINIAEVMSNGNGLNGVVEYIERCRAENELPKLDDVNMWRKILALLLMTRDGDDRVYSQMMEKEQLSLLSRQNYLKQCYRHCGVELMDLENLSPKLQILMSKLDQLMREVM